MSQAQKHPGRASTGGSEKAEGESRSSALAGPSRLSGEACVRVSADAKARYGQSLLCSATAASKINRIQRVVRA
ncbi:MAG: hypothetical protein HGA24_07365 [Candidatus Aminicenantes bacterium]|nr:hypothetical protein [Candidatus Aminicenantes bacterium]